MQRGNAHDWANTSDPIKVGYSGMPDTGLHLVDSRNQGCNGLFLLYSAVEVWSLIVVIIKPLDSDCHRETAIGISGVVIVFLCFFFLTVHRDSIIQRICLCAPAANPLFDTPESSNRRVCTCYNAAIYDLGQTLHTHCREPLGPRGDFERLSGVHPLGRRPPLW